MRNDKHGFQTDAIHAGEAENSSSTPVSFGATSDAVYYRTGNPTLAAFEAKNKRQGEGPGCGGSGPKGTRILRETSFTGGIPRRRDGPELYRTRLNPSARRSARSKVRVVAAPARAADAPIR